MLRILRFATLLAAAMLVLLPLQAEAGNCGKRAVISFAGINWESGEFITAVTREMLERGFGCRTQTIPGNSVTLEQAVSNDDVQIFAEEWTSRSDVWKVAAEAGKVTSVGHPIVGAVEGWYVPAYLVKGDPARGVKALAPGLKRVDQLSDPQYVRLFKDPEQPSKGRFLNCPSGWTCEGVNSAKLKAYGLSGAYVDFRPGTGPAMDAAITAAYMQGQPILFYYWSPSPIAGKLKLIRLEEPAYEPTCWKDLTSTDGRHTVGCAAPEAEIAYGVSTAFSRDAPDIMAVLAKATYPIDVLNANIVAMTEQKRDPKVQAVLFLREHPEIWHGWVGAETARTIDQSLKSDKVVAGSATAFPASWSLSIRKSVNDLVAGIVTKHGKGFRAVADGIISIVVFIDTVLGLIPWWLLIAIFMGLAWLGARRISLVIAVGVLMSLVGVLGLWDMMLQTLTLMLVSTLITLLLGLPLGVVTAKSRWARAVIFPTLDVMQTMPSFVYLLPALMLFGLGKVPAIIATIIYALPPMIRLTALGIEQVDKEIREAGTAFGVTPLQMLLSVELPLALPSLMAGVNQTIMLALSMVVIASMIGARGLGEQVLNGIQTLNVGEGLEAGIGIVILAIVLDRVSQGFGARVKGGDRS